VVKIDPNTDTVVDSIAVGDAPKSMILDKDFNLWVLCEGKVYPT
jgi:DNA-binding beta-propeller fold protein YncE